MEDVSLDDLRRNVLDKRNELSEAIRRYSTTAGRWADFILGPDVQATAVPQELLSNCRLLTDRYELIRRMPNQGDVVEVGTQTGQFAKFILNTHPDLILKTIDIDYSRFAKDELQPFIDSGRLTTIEGSSWEELEKFPEDHFSWVYVDASHYYDHVKKDLEAARYRVKVGGYIVCNDYANWSPFEAAPYGVLQAVNEFLRGGDFEVSYFALHPFAYHDIALRRRS
jgi:predicted O-methyltransferase YrrM